MVEGEFDLLFGVQQSSDDNADDSDDADADEDDVMYGTI